MDENCLEDGAISLQYFAEWVIVLNNKSQPDQILLNICAL